jgi:predicted metal-dependent hydrolase
VDAVETAARIRLPGGPLEYTLRASPRARRLRVTVDPRRGVVVTIPASPRGRARAAAAVEPFLVEREPWLRHHLARHAAAVALTVSDAAFGPGASVRFRGESHVVRFATAPSTARRSSVTREGSDAGDELVLHLASRDRRAPATVLRGWLAERARTAVESEIGRHASALGVAPAGIALRDPRTRWGSASRSGRLSFSWRLVLAPPEALETVVVHELAHLRVFGHGAEFWALVASRRPDHREWRRWLRRHSVELHATLATPAPDPGGR